MEKVFGRLRLINDIYIRMMVNTCSLCNGKFEEKELELSHDIPRYIGGTDLDGRHYLCKECHNKYELEVIKRSFMYLVKECPEWKSICRSAAKKVKEMFYDR